MKYFRILHRNSMIIDWQLVADNIGRDVVNII